MAAVVLCCFLVLVWLGVSWSCINIFRRRPRPLFQEVFASPKLTSEVRRGPLWFSFGWSTFFTCQWEIKALPKIQCEGVAASSVCQWLACVKRITWSVLGVQWSLNLCGTGSLSVEIYLNCIWNLYTLTLKLVLYDVVENLCQGMKMLHCATPHLILAESEVCLSYSTPHETLAKSH